MGWRLRPLRQQPMEASEIASGMRSELSERDKVIFEDLLSNVREYRWQHIIDNSPDVEPEPFPILPEQYVALTRWADCHMSLEFKKLMADSPKLLGVPLQVLVLA